MNIICLIFGHNPLPENRIVKTNVYEAICFRCGKQVGYYDKRKYK